MFTSTRNIFLPSNIKGLLSSRELSSKLDVVTQKSRFTPFVLPYALCKCKNWIPGQKIHKNKSSLYFLGIPYSWWYIYINKKSRFTPFVLPYALSKCENRNPCQKIHKNKSGFHFLGISSSCFSLGRSHLNSDKGGRRAFCELR